MKKLTSILLFVVICICVSGCKTTNEVLGDLTITCVKDSTNSRVVSKNVYYRESGITIEHTYFYNEDGRFIGSAITTIDANGKIIGHVINQTGSDDIDEGGIETDGR